MKVLVTGATGFIGGTLARELGKQGYAVRALVRKGSSLKFLNLDRIEPVEGDLLDPASLKRALAGCEALFHAAALYTFWTPGPDLFYRTNVEGTQNILKAAAEAGIGKIVYTSSESAVGIDAGCTAGNEAMLNDLKNIPGDYKKSKFIAENLVKKMCREGLPAVIVNPTTPIGPFDVKPPPTGKIVVDYLKGKMFACVDTGLNIVDVEDVARGHILALQKGKPGERYLLGNRNMTLREIMSLLEKITGIRAPRLNIPHWLALGAGIIDEFFEGRLIKRYPRIPAAAVRASGHYRHFDCSRALRELGMPVTPPEVSLKKAVDWFRANGYAG